MNVLTDSNLLNRTSALWGRCLKRNLKPLPKREKREGDVGRTKKNITRQKRRRSKIKGKSRTGKE